MIQPYPQRYELIFLCIHLQMFRKSSALALYSPNQSSYSGVVNWHNGLCVYTHVHVKPFTFIYFCLNFFTKHICFAFKPMFFIQLGSTVASKCSVLFRFWETRGTTSCPAPCHLGNQGWEPLPWKPFCFLRQSLLKPQLSRNLIDARGYSFQILVI